MFGLLATDAALDTVDSVVDAATEEARRAALLEPMERLMVVDPASATWRDVYEAVGALTMVADQLVGVHIYTHNYSDPDSHDPDVDAHSKGFKIGMLDLDSEIKEIVLQAVDRAVEAQNWPCISSGWSRPGDQIPERVQMQQLSRIIHGKLR